MRRLGIQLALAFFVVTFAPSSAAALALDEVQCHWQTEVSYLYGEAHSHAQRVCSSVSTTSSSTAPDAPAVSEQEIACSLLAGTLNLTAGLYCLPTEPVPSTSARLTPERVASAFQNTPLPAAVLHVQPPGGRTLVNFDTNFFTSRAPFTTTLRLLGQRVTLEITPARFTWNFGDGESTRTTTPGAKYPDLQVTHSYQRADPVHPSVDTTYTARFRVGQGAWRAVPGSVTIAGASAALDVVEATPTLVNYQ